MADKPDFSELDKLRSVEELSSHLTTVRNELKALDAEYDGLPFPDEAREQFATTKEMETETERRITELTARKVMIERMAGDENKVERFTGDSFKSPRSATRELDIYDLDHIRQASRTPHDEVRMLRDNAKRAVEIARFPGALDRAAVQEYVTFLLDNVVEEEGKEGVLARRILATGNPIYDRAFGKAVTQKPLTSEEARALSLTGASGGFAVPFDLDPTVMGTSNGTVNPWRQIARVIPITGDEWRGVTSGAITTAYAAEATETTDNAPTLAQPTISTEKAQAFVPFSIEIGMDWGGLRAEIGGLLQESKDDLEAAKFATGSGTNEPFGVIVGATNTVTATAGQTFDVEDLYRLENALPPRYRSRASIVANRAIYNLTRQFDTSGGANLWLRIGDGLAHGGRLGQALLGYPTYEASTMDSSAATNNEFMIIGDFSRFVIVDRVGLDVELIPHLFGANQRPTGQRGLYAFWRNGSKVVDANAFRVLLGIA